MKTKITIIFFILSLIILIGYFYLKSSHFFAPDNSNLFKNSLSQKLLDYYLDTKQFTFIYNTSQKTYLIQNNQQNALTLPANNQTINDFFSKWQSINTANNNLLNVPLGCNYLVISINSDDIRSKDLINSIDSLQCSDKIQPDLIQL